MAKKMTVSGVPPNEIDHANRSHAVLSASAAKRWLNCPPSARLNEQFPNVSSEFAEEGTAAHELCEYKVRKYLHDRMEQLDAKGVLVERNDAETSQFALFFEFDGDKNHIRHVLYCCSASRPATEGETTEESKSVKTEKLSLKATALPNGLVKSKTCESTDESTYNNWYNSVYMPTISAANSTGTKSTGTKTTN